MILIVIYLLFLFVLSKVEMRLVLGLIFGFVIAGNIVYDIREVLYYNLPGDREKYNGELLTILVLLTPIFLTRIEWNNTIELSKFDVRILFLLELIGAFIMTNGFTNIPLLNSSVDASRRVVQSSSGVGIGFFLLVFSGSILMMRMFRTAHGFNARSVVSVGVIFLPFILYGGRSLMLFPFVCVILDRFLIQKRTINAKFIVMGILLTFIFVSSFGIWREFGSLSLNTESIAWLVGDLATEYRSGVNVLYNLKQERLDQFWQNIYSGLFPGFIWDVVGEDKAKYYHQIGIIVTKNSHYFREFDGGMRLGILGELAISTWRSRLIVTLTIFMILQFVKRVHGYIAIPIFCCLFFSVPYGINFIMNAAQFVVYSFLIFGLLSYAKNSVYRV